jgi:glycine betaine catabolism A
MADRALPALRVEEVARTCRALEEASMLPREAYVDPRVLEWELDELFLGGWIAAGHVEQAGERGRFLTCEVGGEGILVVGDDAGVPHAFHNTCRHRGARIVDASEGRVRRLQCPYHAWCYRLDGSLSSAPYTDGLVDFDLASSGLHGVRCEVVGGLVLLDASGRACPAADHVGDLVPWLQRYGVHDLRRAARRTYQVGANWKVIGENYSECLHCPGVHPELNRLSHYLSGENLEGAGAWCGGSMTLRDGAATMGRENGDGHGRPTLAGLDATDAGRVLYFLLLPNLLVSLHPDYAMLHTLWPRAVDCTEVVCDWLFEPATMAAPGFDPRDAVDFWDQVNREDWRVCELAQRGMASRAFTPGRYTEQEQDVHAFDVMVARRYLQALGADAAVPA